MQPHQKAPSYRLPGSWSLLGPRLLPPPSFRCPQFPLHLPQGTAGAPQVGCRGQEALIPASACLLFPKIQDQKKIWGQDKYLKRGRRSEKQESLGLGKQGVRERGRSWASQDPATELGGTPRGNGPRGKRALVTGGQAPLREASCFPGGTGGQRVASAEWPCSCDDGPLIGEGDSG